MDKFKPHQFLKAWFKANDVKEQARLVQIRDLCKPPLVEIKLPGTLVNVGFKLGWNNQASLLRPTIMGGSAFKDGRAFAAALQSRKGYKQLGKGAYGTVLMHPNGDKVLKVIHNPIHDGWPEYVKWANDTGYAGTFAPLVHSYKYVKKGGFAIATMEKLDKTAAHMKKNEDVYAKYQMFTNGFYMKENKLMQTLMDLAEPGLAKFSQDFVKVFGTYNDLHSGNVMARGDQLVITDPTCSRVGVANSNGDSRWRHSLPVIGLAA